MAIPNTKTNTWTTRDGMTLPIAQMSTTHLLATIHLIERKRMEAIIGLIGGMETRTPVELIDHADRAILDYYTSWPDAYDALLDEAERRQLVRRGTRAKKLTAK